MLRIADAAWADLRQAVRRITRSPVLSLVVIGTLALAIAANTTIFSLLRPTVLRSLAAPDADALVSIGATDAKTGAYSAIHLPALQAMRGGQRSFSTLGAFLSSVVRVEFGAQALDTGVEGVTPEYFDVLGVRTQAGRLLMPADDQLTGIGVISERLATRLFGSGAVVGQAIVVDGRRVEIIGVLADDFTGVRMDGGDDLFLPLPYLRAVQSGDFKAVPRAQTLIGRLAPGISLEQARAEVLGRWPSIQAAVASGLPVAQQPVITAQVLSVNSFAHGFSGTRDRYGRSLMLVMGLALALLGVGCVNLSGLMLARGLARQHEFAIRIALGVSRARLMQQTLLDGVLLSLAAFVVAIPMSWWAGALLASMVSVSRALPIGQTTADAPILVLAGGVSILTGLLIGLLPARRALSHRADDTLRGRGIAHGIHGASRAVLITQIALSMILVVGAGLFAATLANLYANDITERDQPILFTRLARNPLQRTEILRQPYLQDLQAQLASIPGADAAAFSATYPAYLAFFNPLPADTVSAGEGLRSSAIGDFVTPGFFELYSIARLSGRDFTWSDNDAAPMVAIVNETLARKLFSAVDVAGRRVQIESGPAKSEVEIVGVVADTAVSSIRERHVAGLYRPMMQDMRHGQTPLAHVRVAGAVADVQPGFVDVVNRQGRHFVRGMLTMEMYVRSAVVEQLLIAGMASVAATLAVVLASIGLFGMLAYSVSSRIREIGIRVSLGATRREVVRMIVKEGLAVAIPGVAIGVPMALAAAWVVRSQLYGVSANDPWTLIGAVLLFIATAAIASWLPAMRASRIQPIDALRQD
jgi:putative ABC transport system permease protein